ncbi:MAG: iron-containing alcohol dehydrogenase [Desulfatiglans sp.]|jgi:alcohol dehydrogenase|nr:iron-containing alcohol dehydrogenase [Thermodesulfobacteriota bacterium]MEE4353021.1 iron-containing alcohol dehydrogenase [Desulfatiglans sp.]
MQDVISIEGVKKTVFAVGAVERIVEECKALGASKCLLVMDRGLSETTIGARVQALFKDGPVEAIEYFEVTPEPDPAIADQGAALAQTAKVDCVIGLGGGSTMDVAKAIGVLATNEGKAEDYVGLNLVEKPGLPTIMVPTTAGTGSEATFTAVFTMREKKAKGGINSPFLYPHTAILDPELTVGLSPEVTASTGMDALTHAIESYTSLQSHFLSEPLSIRAIELISDNLRGAVFDGSDLEFRERMMEASYLAGLGLAMSGVGAVHALAYPLGAFFDVPHGVANALLLPYVLEYNFPGNIFKFAQIACLMGEMEDECPERVMAARVIDAVGLLAEDIGIPMTLHDLNIPVDAIPKMAEAAMNVTRPIMNNPRPMKVEIARNIYERAFEGRSDKK